MGLFGPRFMFDEGTTNWFIDTFAWALEHLGTDVFYQHTPLVLPNDTFFPDEPARKKDIPRRLFDRVRKHARMEEWPCRLVAQEKDAETRIGPGLVIRGAPSGPAGSFSTFGDRRSKIEISYNPDDVRRPQALVATFAHELAHYRMHSIAEPTPGGEEFEEHATDLIAVFMGFGVFLANSAFTFTRYSDADSTGWETIRQGYLSESELTYCLAVFLHLKGLHRKTAASYLDKHLRRVLKTATREMKHLSGEMERLRSIRSNKLAQAAM